jgi:hypothetical protein
MRRLAVVFFVTMFCAGAPVATASASTTNFEGTFSVQFPKGHPASNAPCLPDAFCGVGSVAGYGAATITILDESFAEIPGSDCLAVTRTEEIDLTNGTGSLILDSSGTFCRPGGSGDSHAGPSSYGAPGKFTLSYTIDSADSTGIFAGVTGSGIETMTVAGGIGVWRLTGTLNTS